jgi:hypothetical protein
MAERKTTRIEELTADGRRHMWNVTRGGDIDDHYEYVGEVVTPSPSLLSRLWTICRDIGLWILGFVVGWVAFWVFIFLILPQSSIAQRLWFEYF